MNTGEIGPQIVVQFAKMLGGHWPLALVHDPNAIPVNPRDDAPHQGLLQQLSGDRVWVAPAVTIFHAYHRHQKQFNKGTNTSLVQAAPRFFSPLIHAYRLPLYRRPLGSNSGPQALLTSNIRKTAQSSQHSSRHILTLHN